MVKTGSDKLKKICSMKKNWKSIFSLSATDTEYFDDMQNKFELVNCPRQGKNCEEHRSVINNKYYLSEQYRRDKDYQKSIYSLKCAYYKANELTDPPCAKCGEVFRSSIIKSLENIQDELKKMTVGIFKTRRYMSSYIESATVLEELKS